LEAVRIEHFSTLTFISFQRLSLAPSHAISRLRQPALIAESHCLQHRGILCAFEFQRRWPWQHLCAFPSGNRLVFLTDKLPRLVPFESPSNARSSQSFLRIRGCCQ
jgi:hypothetical protein